MERLTKENGGQEKPNGDLKINVVRHGPSSYKQPEWNDIETANDLSTVRDIEGKSENEINQAHEDALNIVRESAEKIANEISPNEEVMIWASPTGRTLETAKIIREVLKNRGIEIRKSKESNHNTKIFEKLGEVKNFKWELFEPLMDGGTITYEGKTFTIDKNLTNPKNLHYPKYFTNDEIKNIPQEVKEKWPEEYVKKIESFESFVDVKKRIMSVLEGLKKIHDKDYRIIVVTHDALASSMINTFTSGKKESINPAQFISLERRGDKLVVTRAGDITEGNDKDDVVSFSK